MQAHPQRATLHLLRLRPKPPRELGIAGCSLPQQGERSGVELEVVDPSRATRPFELLYIEGLEVHHSARATNARANLWASRCPAMSAAVRAPSGRVALSRRRRHPES